MEVKATLIGIHVTKPPMITKGEVKMKFELFVTTKHAQLDIEAAKSTAEFLLPMRAPDWATATKNALRGLKALGLLDDIDCEGLVREWSNAAKDLKCRHFKTGRGNQGGIYIHKLQD